jgi:hypothetical protein
VRTANVIRTHRPVQGSGAFVRVAIGMTSMGGCTDANAQYPRHAARRGFTSGLLERAENPMNPGEGSVEPT